MVARTIALIFLGSLLALIVYLATEVLEHGGSNDALNTIFGAAIAGFVGLMFPIAQSVGRDYTEFLKDTFKPSGD
jgi:hypothetical protein